MKWKHSLYIFLFFLIAPTACLTASENEIILKRIILKSSTGEVKKPISEKGIFCVGLSPQMVKPLKKRLKSFLGKSITKEQIDSIKQAVFETYEDEQMPMVLVNVPRQSVKDGSLTLDVTEATLGKITFEGNTWTKKSTLEGMFNLEVDEPINQQLLMNNIEFLNKNPFRLTRATYRPGEKFGSTDVTLYIDEKNPFRIYAGVNNNGIPGTQLTRLYTGLTYGNCFSQGQVFSAQFTTSSDFKDLLSGTGAYMIPLPKRQLLSLFGGYSTAYTTNISNVMKNTGYSWQVSGRYTIPLNASADYAHEVLFGVDFKRLNNTIEFVSTFPIVGQTVTISELVMAYFGTYKVDGYSCDFDAGAYYSPGNLFSGQSAADYHSLNPYADANFFYFRGSLINTVDVYKKYLLKLIIKGQASTNTLLAPETFGLGGESTVRGYYERTINGDNGLLARGEIYSPPAMIFSRNKGRTDQFRLLGFLDYGFASNWKKVGTINKFNYLIGAGLGLRYQWLQYIQASFDYGFRIHKKGLPGGLGRPYVSAQVSY